MNKITDELIKNFHLTPVHIKSPEKEKSLRQKALLKFMCALIKDTTLPHGNDTDINWLTKTASLLTDAYINELNK